MRQGACPICIVSVPQPPWNLLKSGIPYLNARLARDKHYACVDCHFSDGASRSYLCDTLRFDMSWCSLSDVPREDWESTTMY